MSCEAPETICWRLGAGKAALLPVEMPAASAPQSLLASAGVGQQHAGFAAITNQSETISSEITSATLPDAYHVTRYLAVSDAVSTPYAAQGPVVAVLRTLLMIDYYYTTLSAGRAV